MLEQEQKKHNALAQNYIELTEAKKDEEKRDLPLSQEMEQKDQEIAILQDELGRIQMEAKKYKAISEKTESAKRIMELEDLIMNLKEENEIIKSQYREVLSKEEPKEYALLEVGGSDS